MDEMENDLETPKAPRLPRNTVILIKTIAVLEEYAFRQAEPLKESYKNRSTEIDKWAEEERDHSRGFAAEAKLNDPEFDFEAGFRNFVLHLGHRGRRPISCRHEKLAGLYMRGVAEDTTGHLYRHLLSDFQISHQSDPILPEESGYKIKRERQRLNLDAVERSIPDVSVKDPVNPDLQHIDGIVGELRFANFLAKSAADEVRHKELFADLDQSFRHRASIVPWLIAVCDHLVLHLNELLSAFFAIRNHNFRITPYLNPINTYLFVVCVFYPAFSALLSCIADRNEYDLPSFLNKILAKTVSIFTVPFIFLISIWKIIILSSFFVNIITASSRFFRRVGTSSAIHSQMDCR